MIITSGDPKKAKRENLYELQSNRQKSVIQKLFGSQMAWPYLYYISQYLSKRRICENKDFTKPDSSEARWKSPKTRDRYYNYEATTNCLALAWE